MHMRDKTVKPPSIKQPSVSGMSNTGHLGSQASDSVIQAGHSKVSGGGGLSATGGPASGKEKKIIADHMKLQAHKAEKKILKSGGEVDGLDVPTPQITGAKNANSVSSALSSMTKAGTGKKRS